MSRTLDALLQMTMDEYDHSKPFVYQSEQFHDLWQRYSNAVNISMLEAPESYKRHIDGRSKYTNRHEEEK